MCDDLQMTPAVFAREPVIPCIANASDMAILEECTGKQNAASLSLAFALILFPFLHFKKEARSLAQCAVGRGLVRLMSRGCHVSQPHVPCSLRCTCLLAPWEERGHDVKDSMSQWLEGIQQSASESRGMRDLL